MRHFFVFFLLWSSTIFADGSCPNNQSAVPSWHTYYITGGSEGVDLSGSTAEEVCSAFQEFLNPVGPFRAGESPANALTAGSSGDTYICTVTWWSTESAHGHHDSVGVGIDTSAGDCGCGDSAVGTTQWYNSDGTFSCVPPPLPPPPPPAPTCTEDTLYTGGCETDKKACADSGGSFGFVGSGSDMKSTCVPADYMGADGLPPCSEGLYPIAQDAGDVTCSAMPSPAPDGSQDTTGDGNTDGNAGNTDAGIGTGGTASTGTDYGNTDASDPDGDGKPTGASAQCNPALDKNCIVNGDTDGDGSADDGSASPSEGCETPPSCTGDAIQCAILFQSYENACSARNFDAADAERQTGLQARGRAAMKSIMGTRTDAGSLLSSLTSITGEAGSCPPPYTISLGVLGQFLVSYDAFCTLAGNMRPFVLALFWFLAGRLVVNAMLGDT